MAKFQNVTPYAVRMKHNHKVTDRVVAVSENGQRVKLACGATYPAHMVEKV